MKVLASALALLAAAPALALPPLTASFGYAADVVSRRSYDFVDVDDHLPKVALNTGYQLALEKGALDLGVAFTSGATGTLSHQSLPASLGLVTLEAAVSYRYPLYRHLEPYARISAGPGWATLVADTGRGALHQTVVNLSATGLAGLSFPFALAKDSSAVLVFDLGVGYALRPAYRFDNLQREVPAHPTGEEIRDAPLALGRLDLSGISYRLAVGMRL